MPQPETLAGAGRDGHHVFHGSGEFDAQDVLVRIEAKRWARKFFLQKLSNL